MEQYIIYYLVSVAVWDFFVLRHLLRVLVTGKIPHWFRNDIVIIVLVASMFLAPMMLLIVGFVELKLNLESRLKKKVVNKKLED